MSLIRHCVTSLLPLGLASAAAAADFSAWEFRQSVEVPAAGLVRLALPPETFDAAQTGLRDLRVLDTAGNELPYVLDHPGPAPRTTRPILAPRVTLEGHETRVTFEVPEPARVRGVVLNTPAPSFVKAVTLEGSADGRTFQILVARQAVFRQGGTGQLSVALTNVAARHLRLILDDTRSAPIPVAGVALIEEGAPAPEPLPVPARITDRTEGAGETRLTVDLGAARLPLVGLRVEAVDPLFNRRVRVLTREWSGEEIRERELAAGFIYRVALEGLPPATQVEIPLAFTAPARELVLVIENGDSPPLSLASVLFQRASVSVVFLAREPGRHELALGQPRAQAPRYDLAPLAVRLQEVGQSIAPSGPLRRHEGYRPAEALPEVPVFGAALDAARWAFRRRVVPGTGAVQRLELPLHALAHAQPDLADLRLISNGRQVLYLLERPGFTRAIDVVAESMAVKDRPSLSRWKVRLPQPRLPVRRLTCGSETALFEREVRVFEIVTDRQGREYERPLGRAAWSHSPEQRQARFTVALDDAPTGDTLWIETDNGDNAPLALEKFQAAVPVVRMLFQTPVAGGLDLLYGNSEATAPRYDLSLVAPQVLAAASAPATLADGDPNAPAVPPMTRMAPALFYVVLGLVVTGLILVILRLAPRPGA